MLATKDRISTRHSQKPCPTSKLRSSGAPIKSKASPFCPNAGSSSARLRGSTAAEGSPKIGKTSIARRSHSCALLQSASCSANSAIPANVSGQTLRRQKARRVVLRFLGFYDVRQVLELAIPGIPRDGRREAGTL